MSEDVSATMRVGITVILVAALVATVLNLMVMSNSLLSGGQTTLQSGIDSVSTQEFASYDNTKVSGTQVATALSLFQGRDVAILIQTKSLTASLGNNNVAFNYGAVVTKDHVASNTGNKPKMLNFTDLDAGQIQTDGKKINGTTFLTPQAKTVFLVDFIEGNRDSVATDKYEEMFITGNFAVWRETGAPYYSGYLHNTNGLVDANYDVIGTTELGNDAFILSSARFSSILIKDPTGSIIGIVFKQLQ